MKNLWILTEERPKQSTLATIIQRFADDYELKLNISEISIVPIFDEEHNFSFSYELRGLKLDCVNKIYIKIVSGFSSFCDFIVFYQKEEPKEGEKPLYVIEETKTDDSESRNTGVYQRASKFVFVDMFFSNIKKIMLYNLQISQKENPTETNKFGTRMLLTLGVEFLGKKLDVNLFNPFQSVEELIKVKNLMRLPPKNNVPILIRKVNDSKITVSGRLYKSNGLSHDPNIGALSLISATLRKLGWNGEIEITKHGLSQCHISASNKFIKIAQMLDLSLEGLNIPIEIIRSDKYWKYELKGEKLGTIFVHLATQVATNSSVIFENHAGCEKGYFIKENGEHIPLPKYTDKDAYKAGDKSKIYHIPDLVILDKDRNEVINIEGKKYENMQKGIDELNNYDDIENDFINPSYKPKSIKRTVVLYGSNNLAINENEVGLLLTEKGKIVLGPNAPLLFKDTKEKLFPNNNE